MRSWAPLVGLLLSLAAHGALALLVAMVWVEAPQLPALIVDLARLEIVGARGDGEEGATARAGGEQGETPPRGPGTMPRPDGASAAPGPALIGPSSRSVPASPPAVPSMPRPAVPPPGSASPELAQVPVPVAPPPPPPAEEVVAPIPIPTAPPRLGPEAVAPSATPYPARSAGAPVVPGLTPPPAAVLDLPRRGPDAADAIPTPGEAPGAVAGQPAGGPLLGSAGRLRERGAGGGGDSASAEAGIAGEAPGTGPDAPARRGGVGDSLERGTASGPGADAPAGVGGEPGRPLALAVPGTSGGDAVGAEYRAYYDGIRRLISQSLRYPPAARRRGLSGTVELEVEVRASGTVGAVAIVRSSSHRVLDDAALDAVRGLPRMPFPPGLPPRALRVRIPVDFELR